MTTDKNELHELTNTFVSLDTPRALFEENLCNMRPTQNICRREAPTAVRSYPMSLTSAVLKQLHINTTILPSNAFLSATQP